jgi:hypothetical protein
MESGDPFGGGVESPVDDPFAGSEEEFEQGEDPFAEEEAHAAGIAAEGEPPIVNKEGERVEPGEGADGATQVPPTEAGNGGPPQSDAPTGQDAPAPGATATDGGEKGEGEGDPTATADGATAANASEASSEERGEAAGAEDPTGAGHESTSSESGAEAGSSSAPEGDAGKAAEPGEQRNEKGETIKRPYLIFTPDGEDGLWREVHWYEDSKGRIVAAGTKGAKKQRMCVVRGQEEALRVGFRALGEPEDGCDIVAVAANYFRLRHIEPEVENQPKVRLKIR